MKRQYKTFWLVVGAVLAVAQFIQPDLSNPPVDPARCVWQRVNSRVAGIVRKACGNCHSYQTQWPWYAKISPISWFMARHVIKGREKLNFDNWSSAAEADQLEEIYDSVVKNKMPLASYLLMHPEARLSRAERDVLLAWANGKF